MTTPHGYEHTDPEDVLEHEPDALSALAKVPVKIDEPVQVQAVGAAGYSVNNYTVTSTTPVQIAQPQPQRAVMVIRSTGIAYLGRSEAEARAKTGFQLGTASTSEQLTMRHREELWCIADTTTVTVSVYQEYWTN